ncbi:hypothetical protein ACJMK2_027052, partial [Sinanodonta woodiana]
MKAFLMQRTKTKKTEIIFIPATKKKKQYLKNVFNWMIAPNLEALQNEMRLSVVICSKNIDNRITRYYMEIHTEDEIETLIRSDWHDASDANPDTSLNHRSHWVVFRATIE